MKLILLCLATGFLPLMVRSQPTPIDVRGGGNATILLLLGNALELPWEFDQPPTLMFPVAFSVGLGYRINQQVDLYSTFNINLLTKVLPDKSKYFVQGWYTEWGAESRYFVFEKTYLLGGIHGTTMRTRDIKQYSDSTRTYEYRYPGVQKFIPSVSVGFGYAGSLGYIEVRIHPGLTTFNVVDDMEGSLLTYSLRYGFNIPFHIR